MNLQVINFTICLTVDILHLVKQKSCFQRIFLTICLGFLLIPRIVLAWGREGHEIVALSAQSQLTNKTIAAINSLRKTQVNQADFNTHEALPPFKYIDSNIPLFFSNSNLDLSL